MKRAVIGLGVFLLLGEMLEYAILPQLKLVLPPEYSRYAEWPLLAMGGILAGVLLGEGAGMIAALAAAALAGFSQSPGRLGVSIFGFLLAAYVAGWLGRVLRVRSIVMRWVGLFLFLALEQLAAGIPRGMFWPGSRLEIPWFGLCVSASFALVFVYLLAPGLRAFNSFESDDG